MKRTVVALLAAALMAGGAVFWLVSVRPTTPVPPSVASPTVSPSVALPPPRPLRNVAPPPVSVTPVAPAPAPAVSPSAPSGSPIAARLAALQSQPGALPREVVLGFFSASERTRFAALARGRAGVTVVSDAGSGNALRLRVDDPNALDALLRDAPTPTVWAPNFVVRPPAPVPPVASPGRGAYLAFGAESLAWLGVPADHATWGRGVTVAVIDSGVDGQAAGLPAGRLTQLDWSGDAGKGWHGTAVAGLIAGGDGAIPGVAPSADLLSIGIMDAEGRSDTFTLALAITEAVARGARVINLSLGGMGDSFVLREAVAEAARRGVAIVAAAGNDAAATLQYPAAYPGVIAVGAVDALGQHADFSNRGAVALAAPGVGVAFGITNTTFAFSGTSASAPFVSGALAYLFAEDPGLTPEQALEILAATADDPGANGQDDQVGQGILNLARVTERATPGIYDAAVGNPAVADASGLARLTIAVQNRGTAPIGQATLVVEWGARRETRIVADLAPGALSAQTFALGKLPTQAEGGLAVVYGVVLAEGADVRPANNARRVVLWREP